MARGRPVRKREHGFEADITTLGRIRTALVLDSSLDRTKASKARELIDALTACLADLTASIQVRKSA